MRTTELAETYAEVEDFLRSELIVFIEFLLKKGYLSEGMNNIDWDKAIKEYLKE